MRYLLTFCVINGKGLANPLGHSFIILSEQESIDRRIEVKHAFGFNAALMTEFDTYWAKLKEFCGFKFDFTGKFGVWKIEDIRWLDLGYGLTGVSISINRELYENLIKTYQRRLSDQENAIKEAKAKLGDIALKPQSIVIFNEEMQSAIAEKRAPRLDLFDIKLTLSWHGITLDQSNTCKTMAVKLMKEAGVPNFFLDHITKQGNSCVLPNAGGQMEPIVLFSEGERQFHESKRTGETRFFRHWGFKNNKLFFTFPPQLCFTTDEYENLSKVNLTQDEKDDLYGYLKQLQKLELLLEPLSSPMGYSGLIEFEHKRLVARIVELYTYFSTANVITLRETMLKKLNKMKYFLNSLYFAINDNWDDNNEIETVANRYSLALQEKICGILERPLAKSALSL